MSDDRIDQALLLYHIGIRAIVCSRCKAELRDVPHLILPVESLTQSPMYWSNSSNSLMRLSKSIATMNWLIAESVVHSGWFQSLSAALMTTQAWLSLCCPKRAAAPSRLIGLLWPNKRSCNPCSNDLSCTTIGPASAAAPNRPPAFPCTTLDGAVCLSLLGDVTSPSWYIRPQRARTSGQLRKNYEKRAGVHS